MTKTDRIRALIKAGKTSREIADEVGCLANYVRVVKQRDAGIDYLSDYRRRIDAAGRNRPDAVEVARKAGRDAYRAALDAGLSYSKACSKAGSARMVALRKYIANNSTPT